MQLKKIFKALLFVAVVALPVFVLAASEYDSDSNIAAGVIGTVSSGATYELNPSKLFSFDSDFGQDLYELTYNRVKSEASDKAAQRVLADRKISQEELFAVVPGANIGNLLTQPDPTTKLNPGEVEKRRQDLQRFLAEEKELADLETKSLMEVQPTEFFSNGDESDSGFDLIVDLNIIEYILFGKVEATMSALGPGAPPGSNVVGVGLNLSGGSDEEPAGAGGGRVPRAGGAGAGAGAGAGPGAGQPGGPAGQPPQSAARAQCPVEESFNNAVEAARTREQIAAAEGEDGAGSGGSRHGGPSGAGGGGAGGAGGAGGIGEEGGEASGKTPLGAEPPANWAHPRACDGPFCLKIEAVYKKESSFQVTDNCIACHFEKTNDAFNKAVSHNLVPSKATGNLIEAPKCKRSMFNLKQNIILIPQPILTPPNDDLITKGDFFKNWLEFTEKYYANPGQCQKLKNAVKDAGRDLSTAVGEVLSLGQICDPKPDPRAEASKQELNRTGDDTDAKQVFNNIETQVEAKKQEAAEILKQYKLQRDAGNQSTQFSVLLQEIDTMNNYFKAFMNLYTQLIDTSPDAPSPCSALLNKEACS